MSNETSRKEPKPQLAWGVYNMGRLMDIGHARRHAVQLAEQLTGKPWKECKTYMEVHKVRVERYAP